MVKRPLTPPPSSALELQDQERTSNMHCDSPSSASIPPVTNLGQTFRSIAQLSLQSKFQELIRIAEQADLASYGEPNNPARLFVIAPMVLAYLVVDDLPPAKHALLRLPESLLSIPLSFLIRNLSTACRQRAYEQIYANAISLNDLLLQPDFFDKDLANVLVHLVTSFIDSFRRRTALLLLEAYTAVPVPLSVTCLGMNKEQVLTIVAKEGWKFHAPSDTFTAGSDTSKSELLHTPGTSSLPTFHSVVDSVSQLEL